MKLNWPSGIPRWSQFSGWVFCRLVLLAFISPVAGHGQTNFINLDFESATPAYWDGYVTNVFPGWSAYSAGVEVEQVGHDHVSLDGSSISIIDYWGTNFQVYLLPLQGDFSALLQGSSFEGSTTLSQTGLVPPGTESLVARMTWRGMAPIVMLGGQQIRMVPMITFTNCILYVGNAQKFAGQTTTLSFTAPVPTPLTAFNTTLFFDNIIFSAAAAPDNPRCLRAASAIATLYNGNVFINLTDGGCGYTVAPKILLMGGGGTNVSALADLHDGAVSFVDVVGPSIGYTNAPTIYIAPPDGLSDLNIDLSGYDVILTWNTNLIGFTLQSTTNLALPDWTTVPTAPAVVNSQNTVTNPIRGTQQFFRLSQ